MRILRLVVLAIAAASLAALYVVNWRVSPPRVGPDVEQICLEAMQKSTPDLSWVAPEREGRIRNRRIYGITLGELPIHNSGDFVRVAGFLHADFEWVALYLSRDSLDDQLAHHGGPSRAPWISFRSLWPGESYWHTKGPLISDRCALVEGSYESGAGGHLGMFNGAIDVLRLDVWSTPHRPVVTTPVPPAAPVAPPPFDGRLIAMRQLPM